MPHVGDLLVELLARYGVTDIFGQPGGQTAALYDGVARRSGRVSHTLVRDERSAAYAADAFARLTRRPVSVTSRSAPAPRSSPTAWSRASTRRCR